jgi:hypothetical protein
VPVREWLLESWEGRASRVHVARGLRGWAEVVYAVCVGGTANFSGGALAGQEQRTAAHRFIGLVE